MKIIGYISLTVICLLGLWNALVLFASLPLSFIEGGVKRMFIPVEFRRPIHATTSVVITAWISWLGLIYLWHLIIGGIMPIFVIILGFIANTFWIFFHKTSIDRIALIDCEAASLGTFVFIITWIIFVPRPLIWF